MATSTSIVVNILFFLGGFGWQFLVRRSPWVNLILSFAAAAILPPGWGLGLIIGIWISCAFFTFNPEQERQFETISTVNWQKIFLAALWTFSGFILTLVFLWKLKISDNMGLLPREILAWVFLILIEICLFRIIAKLVPRLYRIPIGYGIAVLNFLMILYWILPLGIWIMGLILLSLLITHPLLLVLVDMPLNKVQDPVFRRNK
jgi:hypothetical protein